MGKCKDSDYYETPPALFDALDQIFRFDLDASATHNNAKCPFYCTEDGLYQAYPSGPFLRYGTDGLASRWHTLGNTFCNPPYSKEGNKDAFIRKAAQEAQAGSLVAMVIPAKTDCKAFHECIWGKAQVEFLQGRPKFYLNGVRTKNSGRSPIMVVVFYPPDFPDREEHEEAVKRALRGKRF